MRYPGFVLLCSFALALGACFDTPTADIAFVCGSAGECPDGYECRADGCCHLIGSSQDLTCDLADAQPPQADAAMADASIDGMFDAMPDAMPGGPILETLTPASVTLSVGETATMTVALDTPAPAGGIVVMTSSSDPAIASVDPSVTVDEGRADATFPVMAQAGGTATITASLGPNSLDSTVTVAAVTGNVGDVVINEFLALSSTGGNRDEFIELVNISGVTLDISGWVLNSDGVENSIVATSLVTADPVYLAPNAVIYGVPNPANPVDIPGGAAFVYGPAGSAFDLGDTGSNLRISDGITDLDIVDFTGWETSPGNTPGPTQFAGLVDRSTQLSAGNQSALDNDDGARWCVPAAATPGADNAPCDAATIDELMVDAIGADDGLEFIEVRAVPGADLGGWRLRSTSSDGTPTGVDLTLAAGTRAPLDSFWVVADNTGGPTQVANADLEAALGLADVDAGLQLIRPGVTAADAIGYGSLTATVDTVDGLPIVEGTATQSAPGSSMARDMNGTDTNQNSVDLQLDPTPTPGVPNNP